MISVISIVSLMYANGWLGDHLVEQSIFFLAFGSLANVGLLLALHRPENPIAWNFLLAALSHSILIAAGEYAAFIAETNPGVLPETILLFWLSNWVWVFAFILPPTLGILLFPSGNLPSRRWRPFVWIAVTSLALMIVTGMFRPGPFDSEGDYPQYSNPIGIESLDAIFTPLVPVTELMAVTLFFGAVVSVFVRLRSAEGVERQQIKWFAYAAMVPIIGGIVELLIIARTDISNRTDTGAGLDIIVIGIAVLPITMGIAILRHNLYDIDYLINRSLVYGSLTTLLLGSFGGSVVLFQFLLSAFTSGNDLAVAGSTLLTLVLVRPIRSRLQGFVDLRFYRKKYDAQRTLEAFALTARDAVDIDRLWQS